MINGERLRIRREQLHMTRDDLAYTLGISPRQLARYELEHDSNPTSETLIAMARELNVSVDWLLGLSGIVRESTKEADLDTKEKRLVELYREKSPEQQAKLLEMAKLI